MPSKTKFLLFLLISGIATNLTAQTAKYRPYLGKVNGVHSYGTAFNFPNNLVADDYGPRTGDPWHSGIDYNAPGGDDQNDLGDLILAIEGGKVSSTSNVNTSSLKWITIEGTHNIAYEHIGECGDISDGEYTGGCLIKNLDGDSIKGRNDWAIIFHINGNYHAIGPINNAKVTFKDEAGVSRTLTVYDTVAQGAPVAPLGNSCKKEPPYDPHAHIQGMSKLKIGDTPIVVYDNNGDIYSKNILEYVTHSSPPYSLTLEQKNLPNGISPVYPGDIKTPLKAHVVLSGESGKRYNSGIMDVEAVEFKIKNALHSDWQNIKGPNFDRFQFGGRMDKGVVPKNFRQSTKGSIIGSWGVYDMDPHAYLKDPFDDFYFNEFYARIHKSDPMNGTLKAALYPWDSRYMDGNYTLKVAVTNANDHWPDNWSGGDDFKIDNFKPFIQRVRVEIDDVISSPFSRSTVYYRSWEAVNTAPSKIKIGARSQGRVKGDIHNKQIIVNVLLSESMSNVQASIPDLQTNWKNGVALDDEKKKWLFTFSPYDLWDNCYEIEFKGQDLNNNQILDLPAPLFCAGGDGLTATVPKRNGASTWDNAHPQGIDEVHRFYIGPCEERPEAVSESPCPEREMIQYSVVHTLKASSGSGTGKITLNISVNYSDWVFTWKNEQGNVISYNPYITGLFPGLYCLEITNGCCSYNDCIEIEDCNYSIPVAVDCATGCINLTVIGNFPPYQVTWEKLNDANNAFNTVSGWPRSDLPGNNGFEDLCQLYEAGRYKVKVNNALCGELTETLDVNCPCNFEITSEEVRHALCGNNGYIRVGTNPYQAQASFDWYKWDIAAQKWNMYVPNSRNVLSNIGPGKYKALARNNCFRSKEFTIYAREDINASIEIVNPVSTCTPQPGYWPYYSSADNGILCIDVSPGAINDYEVVWSNGSTGRCRHGLEVGTYAATLVFDDGCEIPVESVDLCCCSTPGVMPPLADPPFCTEQGGYPPYFSIGEAEIVGSFDNDGSISFQVEPSNGATYKYNWSPTSTGSSATVTNLVPGNYCVTVSHVCGIGHTATKCFEVQGCSSEIEWTVGMKTTNIKTCTAEFAQDIVGDLLLVNTGNQMGPFTYKWTGPNGLVSTEKDLFNLVAGVYNVTVTDNCGRTKTARHDLKCCNSVAGYLYSDYECFGWYQDIIFWEDWLPRDGHLEFRPPVYISREYPPSFCNKEITLFWYDGTENKITWNAEEGKYDGLMVKHPPEGHPGQYCVSWTNRCGCVDSGCAYFGGEGLNTGFNEIDLVYFMQNNRLNGFESGVEFFPYYPVIYRCAQCNGCGGGYQNVIIDNTFCNNNGEGYGSDFFELHDEYPYDQSPCSGQATINCDNNPPSPLDPWTIPPGIEGVELIDYTTIEYKTKPDGTPICVHPAWCLFTGSQIDNFPRSEPVLVKHPVGKIIDEGVECLPLVPPPPGNDPYCNGGVIIPDPDGVNERCELKWYCLASGEVVETEVLDEFIVTCRCDRSTTLYSDCKIVKKCITFNPAGEGGYPDYINYLCGGFEVLLEETENCESFPNIPDCINQARPGSERSVKENEKILKEAVKTGEPKFKYTVFPNPFLEHLTIQMENTEKLSIGQDDHLTISIFDIAGHYIGQKKFQLDKETLVWDLQPLHLPKGSYLFTMESPLEHMNVRFLMIKAE